MKKIVENKIKELEKELELNYYVIIQNMIRLKIRLLTELLNEFSERQQTDKLSNDEEKTRH